MGCAGLLFRLAWFALGHLTLLIFALLIAERGSFSVFDLGYWLTIAFILGVRWIDITRFGGLTRNGEVASPGDWRRHAGFLVLAGGLIWALIHLGWYWFGR